MLIFLFVLLGIMLMMLRYWADNSCFEKVEQIGYLGTAVTNQNSIQED
jgi:hypothetical protein